MRRVWRLGRGHKGKALRRSFDRGNAVLCNLTALEEYWNEDKQQHRFAYQTQQNCKYEVPCCWIVFVNQEDHRDSDDHELNPAKKGNADAAAFAEVVADVSGLESLIACGE